jgi:serine/threonine-protein kinase HipA
MRTAKVLVKGLEAGILIEIDPGKKYRFLYHEEYIGNPVSLTMPVNHRQFDFDTFPSFFDGLLPEGVQLEGLLKIMKIDRDDCFSQLMAVGEDMVGAVTVKEMMV